MEARTQICNSRQLHDGVLKRTPQQYERVGPTQTESKMTIRRASTPSSAPPEQRRVPNNSPHTTPHEHRD